MGISRVATLSGAVDHLLVVAHRQIRVTPGGGAEQPLEHGRIDIVVAVDEADPLRCRPVHARVGSGRHPTRTVLRQQHRQEPGIGVAERNDLLRCRVGRPIVDHQHLDVAQGLGCDAVETLLDVALDVVSGHDDAQVGHVRSFRSRHASARRMMRLANPGSRESRIRVKSPRSILSKCSCRRRLNSSSTSGVIRVFAQPATRSTKSQ